MTEHARIATDPRYMSEEPLQRAGCTLFPMCSEARSNTGAVRHAHELVVRPIRTFARVHRPAADLAVRRVPIAGRGLVMGDFIERPAMGALEGLGHSRTIGSNRSSIHRRVTRQRADTSRQKRTKNFALDRTESAARGSRAPPAAHSPSCAVLESAPSISHLRYVVNYEMHL
jgi:hypothetical protein